MFTPIMDPRSVNVGRPARRTVSAVPRHDESGPWTTVARAYGCVAARSMVGVSVWTLGPSSVLRLLQRGACRKAKEIGSCKYRRSATETIASQMPPFPIYGWLNAEFRGLRIESPSVESTPHMLFFRCRVEWPRGTSR